jgi:hypothetical protein
MWRKLQDLGIAQRYNTEPDVASKVKKSSPSHLRRQITPLITLKLSLQIKNIEIWTH